MDLNLKYNLSITIIIIRMQLTKKSEINKINSTLNINKRNQLEFKIYPKKVGIVWSGCAVIIEGIECCWWAGSWMIRKDLFL